MHRLEIDLNNFKTDKETQLGQASIKHNQHLIIFQSYD